MLCLFTRELKGVLTPLITITVCAACAACTPPPCDPLKPECLHSFSLRSRSLPAPVRNAAHKNFQDMICRLVALNHTTYYEI